MRKLLEILLTAVVATILIVVCGVGINSCSDEGLGKYFNKNTEAMSTDISLSIENILNPSMESTTDVVASKIEMCEQWKTDSIFRSLSNTMVLNISSVLLDKYTTITKYDIVKEYLANKTIYDSLPKGSITNYENTKDDSPELQTNSKDPVATMHIVKEGSTTVTGEPDSRVIDISNGQYKDTVIDGKPALIKRLYEPEDIGYLL